MMTKIDTPGTTSTIELVDAFDLLQTLATAEAELPRPLVEETDRGLQLIRSHQRQRDIRRQAMGWR